AARMHWRRPARKSGHRQIERSPEEMDRATFADEVSAKLRKDARALQKRPPPSLYCLAIIRGMHNILMESQGVRKLARLIINGGFNSKLLERSHDFAVKVCHRHRPKRDRRGFAFAGKDQQPVIHKIEVNLKRFG